MRLGFACVWDPNPRRTWSYTPWDLREALRRRPDVETIDLGIALPAAARRLLQLMSLRRESGRWVAAWEHLRLWEMGIAAYLNRRATKLRCDAVLQIQDLAVTSVPYFVYQDLSYDVLAGLLEQESQGLRQYFPHLDHESIARRRRRQHRIYAGASGVFAMSEFLRRSLVHQSGLAPSIVHTVHPGAVPSAVPASERDDARLTRTAPRRRLLFVGTTFRVKGGDQLIAALAQLRIKDPQIRLTVVGPSEWPEPGQVPAGVHFLGRVDPQRMPGILDSHDLLAVPSRFEGFGKIFIEALSRGLPCVGRNAFAMPEMIRPGENGDLVRGDSPEELAACIDRVLSDDGIYKTCAAERQEVLDWYNWDRAAGQMVEAMRNALACRVGSSPAGKTITQNAPGS